MVFYSVFIPICHVNTVQDDISANKIIPILLYHTVLPLCTYSLSGSKQYIDLLNTRLDIIE